MKYTKIKYPDGQISAKLLEIGSPPYPTITERINSYEDLMFVRSLADALQNVEINQKTMLFIPCLFGQRSDRRFDEKQSFDLKLVAEVINACKFKRVSILDPHSEVALALIDRSVRCSSLEYVSEAVEHIVANIEGRDKLILVSPDAGAYKKVWEYGEKLNLPVAAAVKHRDLNGNVNLIFTGDVTGKVCLIVDDLIDGGSTFHQLAEQLKTKGALTVNLYTTHAYFSRGIDFTPHINHFYCTNSVKDIEHPKVTQFEVV